MSKSRNDFESLVRESRLVNHEWYLWTYQDVRKSGFDPIKHYLEFGGIEGRNPNPYFDTRWYIKTYGISAKRQNPLVDFIKKSPKGLRDPNPYFSSKYYLLSNPDVAQSGINPLAHFIYNGAKEGRDPSPNFSLERYLSANPEVKEKKQNPLLHFLQVGQKEGREALPVHGIDKSSLMSRLLDPGVARKPAEENLGRWIRTAVFALGCATYASRRKRSSVTSLDTSHWSSWTFFRFALARYKKLGIDKTFYSRPNFSSCLLPRHELTNYGDRLRTSPYAGLMLFVANSLKQIGLTRDAERLLVELAEREPVKVLASVSLADMLITQARWASEYRAYDEFDAVIEPCSILGIKNDASWHDVTYKQAIDILIRTTELDKSYAEAWILLAFAEMQVKNWRGAIRALGSYLRLRPQSNFARTMIAQALFGISEVAGVDLRKKRLDQASHSNVVGSAELTQNVEALPECSRLHIGAVVKSANLPLSYTLVGGGRIGEVRKRLEYGAECLVETANTTLLPQYGSALVDRQHLLVNYSHMHSSHLTVFTTSVEVVSGQRCLYNFPKPTDIDHRIGCYIGSNSNYFHWLIEDAPRVEFLLNHTLYRDVPILIDERSAPWQTDLLKMLGVKENRLLQVNFKRPVTIQQLVLPPRLSKNLVVHPRSVDFLRSNLLPRERPSCTAGKRIYLSRGAGSTKRAFLNEKEVENRLHKEGFVSVNTGEMTLAQQMELMSDVEIIAGAGGAAMSNMVFAPAGAKILAFGAESALSETFTSLAAACGQKYVLCTGTSYPNADRHWIWTRFDFTIDMPDLDLALEQVL